MKYTKQLWLSFSFKMSAEKDITFDLDRTQNEESSQRSENTRKELVDAAVRFLVNPKVLTSSLDSRKAFLKKKGLTDAEIAVAVSKAKEVNPYVEKQEGLVPLTTSRPLTSVYTSKSRSWWWEYTVVGVVVVGVAYFIITLIKRYVIPWFQRRDQVIQHKLEQVQQNIKEIRDSLTQTSETLKSAAESLQEVTTQQNQLSTHSEERMLTDMRNEISSLKSLIVGRNQFPNPPATAAIPDWQRGTAAAKETSTSMATTNETNSEAENEEILETD